MELILTHENGDFDGIAGVLAASKLYPDALPVLPERLNQNVARFMRLYESGLPFVRRDALRLRTVSRVVLVDTQRPVHIKQVSKTVLTDVIDHHPLSQKLPESFTFTYEMVGAVTTLLVEKIKAQSVVLAPLEATLLLLGIYEDTGSLVYGTTTARDLLAAGWLLEQGAALDTVRRYLTPPLDAEQQSLLEQLVKHVETRSINGHLISISAVVCPEHISEVSSVAHRLRDLLDSSALFVVVEMPTTGVLVVARSIEDGVDVGAMARLLGGGGHGRAAAATLRDRSAADVSAFIWDVLPQHVIPPAFVSDLMSFGVNTVEASRPLDQVIRQLRQIGHEGYPVTDKGKLVGLLARRDLDRADEHGMRKLLVRDVMTAGEVALRPTDSIFDLERKMLESGWGQIPVQDEGDKLIGVVTRTDLIKYWTRRHPSPMRAERTISLNQIEAVLGATTGQVIQNITAFAQDNRVTTYLVGGVVRDLLLGRPNFDIDFVVEGDAIQFAASLKAVFGGEVTAFKPFGTAKWLLAGSTVFTSPSSSDVLPDHIDFASSRYEFYEYPTALPTVYNSSIKLDLQRRDFTINTLAIQLSPAAAVGRVLDFFGGLRDLDANIVRVLHSLSFIDDPTRILRATRFEQRLKFSIEPRTAELMTTALPILERVTGERLRNELDLLLRESEPEQGLRVLEERAILQVIHPSLKFDDYVSSLFAAVRQPGAGTPWAAVVGNLSELYWRIWFSTLPATELAQVCNRLLIAGRLYEALVRVAEIVQLAESLSADIRPSQVSLILAEATEIDLLAAWYVIQEPNARENIRQYWLKWRHIQPRVTGNHLRERGLPPGPCYGKILKRLRDAWLDGIVQDEVQERTLLEQFIGIEGICGDSQ